MYFQKAPDFHAFAQDSILPRFCSDSYSLTTGLCGGPPGSSHSQILLWPLSFWDTSQEQRRFFLGLLVKWWEKSGCRPLDLFSRLYLSIGVVAELSPYSWFQTLHHATLANDTLPPPWKKSCSYQITPLYDTFNIPSGLTLSYLFTLGPFLHLSFALYPYWASFFLLPHEYCGHVWVPRMLSPPSFLLILPAPQGSNKICFVFFSVLILMILLIP